MIDVQNTIILWGDFDITAKFNLISTSDLPSTSAFMTKIEALPNGGRREIKEREIDKELTITVARESKQAEVDELKALFRSLANEELKVIQKNTGIILAKYEYAVMQTEKFMSAIDQGGHNIELTFSLDNENTLEQ